MLAKLNLLKVATILLLGLAFSSWFTPSFAQMSFSRIVIEGSQRVENATILSYANIAPNTAVSSADLNDAYQRLLGSGLFEDVQVKPSGNRLTISVREFPTISRINVEGNKRIKDDKLLPLLSSESRRVYSPSLAEADAETIVEAYRQAGRFTADVNPVIIRRSNNRVDLVFEIFEGKVVEVERLSFVGNRNFSDRKLRRIVQSKQAGILRQLIKGDTFIADRVEFDKQLLRDFYASRGYIDFQVLSSISELARQRDAFFVTFRVQEGQSYEFGEISFSSELADADPDEFADIVRLKSGITYSPAHVDTAIERMENLALKKGLNFVRIDPRITRNDFDKTLAIEFNIVRGERIFVERIDIEGNTTTLDRVIRRQFRFVEGDPFNARQIRDAAERIQTLGFFAGVPLVQGREGSSPDQVIVDVDVEEQPTGSISFGVAYGASTGIGGSLGISEKNFLGRGQTLSAKIDTTASNRAYNFNFVEPHFLSRDLSFGITGGRATTDNQNAAYDTVTDTISPSIEFPASRFSRIRLAYSFQRDQLTGLAASPASSTILNNEASSGTTSKLAFTYARNTIGAGFNPAAGTNLEIGAEFAGLGGSSKFLKTSAKLEGRAGLFKEEVAVTATLEGGVITAIGGGGTRIVDRFAGSNQIVRGFQQNGLGPRDMGATNDDALGGNFFVSARFEAVFPIGLPEEYGVNGGLYYDIGSVWGLNDTAGSGVGVDPVVDARHLRSAIGISIFWKTAIGPLRFNFSRPLSKQPYDKTQIFNLTLDTAF
jgi:outer membrane protein insertion porin family